MKKKAKIMIFVKRPGLLLLLSWALSLYGQHVNTICSNKGGEDSTTSHLLGMPYRDINPFSDKVSGSNQWGWGTVYLNTGDSVPGRYIVYNAVGSNLLWIKSSKESALLIDKTTVKGFTMLSEKQNKIIHFRYFPAGNWFYSDGKGGFFEELAKGTLSLYTLNTIEKFPMSDDVKPHKYYFIYSPATGLKRIMLNRKSLCTTLKSKEFLKYMREHNIKANKHDRMIRAVEEFNRFLSVNPQLLRPYDVPVRNAL